MAFAMPWIQSSSDKEIDMDKNEERDILRIENLNVRFETEDGVVHAVNGIDMKKNKYGYYYGYGKYGRYYGYGKKYGYS